MRRSIIATVTVPALLVLLQGPLGAQDTIVVPDTPVCDGCMELEVVLSFGFADDEGALLTRYPLITRLPDGRWVVTEAPVGGTIRIYDSDGSFQRAVEARGEGPGEYRVVSRLFSARPDGYALYDPGNDRISYVTDDFSFQSSSPFSVPSVIRIEALSDGSFVVNALAPRTAAQGHMVNVVDSTGSVRASFGGNGTPLDLREGPHVRHRVIAVDQSDHIWAGAMEKYELKKYDADGRLLLSVSRKADWFEPHTNTLPPRDVNSDAPNPKLRELTVDNNGRIWAVVWVPDPEWRSGVPNLADPANTYDEDKFYDSVLEMIDPGSGRVVSRTHTGYALSKVHIVGPEFGEPLYFRTIQQDDGFIRADILRAVYK